MSFRHKLASWLVVVCVMLSLALTVDYRAMAAEATGTMVASGLVSPRYLVVNDDGSVYLTEAGNGGDEKLQAPPGEGGPPDAPPPTRGYTGRVLKIGADGTKTVVADKLPSIGSGGEATGPAGIVLAGGAIWISTGNASEVPLPPLTNQGSVVKINIQNGAAEAIANLFDFEKANNPDPNQVDSNPYGMVLGPDGNLYVADAGGNDILRVNPSTKQISLLAVVPGIPFPQGAPGTPPTGNPERGNKFENDPVPTAIINGPDGNSLYVGLLAGFGFGTAKVLRVSLDGKISDVATGLNPVTGLAIGPDKNLYVAEFATGFGEQGPAPGRVLRIKADGTQEVVASNLTSPNGIAFDKAGNLFVLTGAGFAPSGSLMRFANVAPAPAPVPAPTPAPTPTPPPVIVPGPGTLPETGPSGPQLYFPQTGFTISGALLSYWRDNGGLPVFGYPIDTERQQAGQVFQWFERNRLELHPENKGPYNVLLGRLGAEELATQGIDWSSLPKVSSAPAGCRYFAETGHSLCGDFLGYWQSHGLQFDDGSKITFRESLALFGYPISEPKLETNSSGDTVLTQWFERARFELHPGNPAEYRVLLGRLGAEVKATRGE